MIDTTTSRSAADFRVRSLLAALFLVLGLVLATAMPARADDARRVVGLAGTVSTLAMVDLGLAVYDEDTVHHHIGGDAGDTNVQLILATYVGRGENHRDELRPNE